MFSLVSDLGGGKTTFTRGLAKGIDSADHVSSPTFKISNIYKGKNLALYHYDFYRLQQDELIALELADALEDPLGVTVIEWASQVPKSVPPSAITVSLLAGPNENSRKLVLTNAPPQLMKGLE